MDQATAMQGLFWLKLRVPIMFVDEADDLRVDSFELTLLGW
jgi:hypothetical protein